MLSATCVDGKVTSEGVEVPGTTILSEGVGSSSGVLILDENARSYLAKISPDLKTDIEKTVDGLTGAASGITNASSGLTSLAILVDPIAGPLAILSAVAGMTAAVASINAAISALNTLKGNLK